MLNVAYAANRHIGLTCLQCLLNTGITPVALFVAGQEQASFQEEMIHALPDASLFQGTEYLHTHQCCQQLQSLNIDYLISVHFPHVIPLSLLEIPRMGCLNLHPAYLPYNRGWHTATWAIIEGTPFGATFHWMDAGLDTGDIALQKSVEVLPHDTAHTLYKRALAAEVSLFMEAIPLLKANTLPRVSQKGKGTTHSKKDIRLIQCLRPDMPLDAMLRVIRGLTTNKVEEAAYVVDGTVKHHLMVCCTTSKNS